MKLRAICMFTLLTASIPFYAQDNEGKKSWTLEDCINYALEKNIQLQQDKISLQESEIDIKDARASLFPTLSFSTGHNMVNRPYQEQSATVSGTEIISSNDKTTYNGNYGLNAQWTLWNGGKRLNNLKQQKTNRDIAQLSVSETENMLQEQIAQLFIQILYADESIRINKGTLEVSEATYQRGKELFNEGSISKADLAQLEAQVSNDKYQVVSAESSLRNYKLQLKQLLELDGTEEMDLILPQLDNEDVMKLLPSQTDIYQTALAIRPEIQSGRLSIENAKLGISAAKSAKLQYNTSQLELVNKQKELYSTIESLWLDALNAQQQYAAAETKVKSSQTSFDMVSEQFNLGMKNTVELLTEKNNLLSAKQELVQAKYMAILNRTLLNFYAGNNIEL